VALGNDPPSCGTARPSSTVLWPPLGQQVRVQIIGIADPNGDGFTVSVTAITQDEPVSGLTRRDTGPDAQIAGGVALLKAQRGANGNGRVYRVGFTATDSRGAACAGFVTVSVPMRRGRAAVDDGQHFVSTHP